MLSSLVSHDTKKLQRQRAESYQPNEIWIKSKDFYSLFGQKIKQVYINLEQHRFTNSGQIADSIRILNCIFNEKCTKNPLIILTLNIKSFWPNIMALSISSCILVSNGKN